MSRHDPSSADHLVGTLLADRYRVIRRIGAGSMGVVFEVEHELIGRRLALKTLHADLSEDANVLARFQREARAAGSIGHQHIIEVTDMGVLPEGSPFIVLELLDGHDLGQEIRTFGALSIPRAIDIALQCCRALHAAHEKGIVHRDLKPDNIFLCKGRDRPDFVKILDFGVSKFLEAAARLDGHATTRTGRTVGTPYYMSPEQCQGARDIDRRADVYAMGVVLFEMLTGRRPFSAPHFPALALKIMQDPRPSILAERPACAPELEVVVHKAMAAKASDRHATAAELADALAPFAEPGAKGSDAPAPRESGDDTETFVSAMTFDEQHGTPVRTDEPLVRPKQAPKPQSERPAVISVEASRLPELSMSRTEAEAPNVHRVELDRDRVLAVEPAGPAAVAAAGSEPEHAPGSASAIGAPSDTERTPTAPEPESETSTPAAAKPPSSPAPPTGKPSDRPGASAPMRAPPSAKETGAASMPSDPPPDPPSTPAVAPPAADAPSAWLPWVVLSALVVAAFVAALYLPRCG